MSERFLKCACQRVYRIEATKPKGYRTIVIVITHEDDYEGFRDAPTLPGLEDKNE